jgi:hypothetical protein
MHGIHAVRRESGNKDPSSREAPRVFSFLGASCASPIGSRATDEGVDVDTRRAGARMDARVAVLNASLRAHHADAALRETLPTMSAALVEEACVTIPLLGAGLDEAGMVQSPDISRAINSALAAVHRAVHSRGD